MLIFGSAFINNVSDLEHSLGQLMSMFILNVNIRVKNNLIKDVNEVIGLVFSDLDDSAPCNFRPAA